MAFLQLEGLTKTFGTHKAVDGLTLTVEKGEFVSLLGPSGCGKTTTLQMIAGFVDPSGGAIRLEGRDLLAMKPAKRGLGIVFQSYALFPHMTVAENVAYGLQARKWPRDKTAARVHEMLALVHMSEFAGRKPRQLSGGQQQRIALARCLAIDPLSALARVGGGMAARAVAERLSYLCRNAGITVLFTSLLEGSDPQLETTTLHVSTIADSWIQLSYELLDGERNRALSIVKARGSKHSTQIRELIFSEKGIAIADPYTAGGMVLMGALRKEKENAA